MKAQIKIQMRKEIVEPVGRALKQRLVEMGYSDVTNVRVGKLVEVEFESGEDRTLEDRAEKMAKELLVNPTIEEFRIEITDE